MMFKYAVLAGALVFATLGVHYAVPQTDVVRAIDIQIKRVDVNGDPATGKSASTRDVSYILTETIDNKKPKVYRNEDNFLYLKWDSTDELTRAQSLAADKSYMAVKHYGWRIAILSAFPNALKVTAVDEPYKPVPVMFFVVLLSVWALVILAFRKVTNFGKSRAERRAARNSNDTPIGEPSAGFNEWLKDSGGD